MKRLRQSIAIVGTLLLLSACNSTPANDLTTIKNVTGCEGVDAKKNYPNYAFVLTDRGANGLPIKAVKDSIKDAYVIYDFDISPSGATTNFRLREAYPGTAFVQTAKDILKEYRYEPRLENGKPSKTACVGIRLNYNVSGKIKRISGGMLL
jgi:hypothetical protein